MTVKELIHLLKDVEPDRIVYIQDIDGSSQPAQYVVDLKHLNLPEGIAISDDVAIMTANTFVNTEFIKE